ncbi:MAG TPA: cell division ATP-binding protein FtsE [Gammaproteobacteria bacterium]|nr:cell division ATP-binding protein FtsE [Gammaproteobacteria bacterium]|tara:strand:- start:5454 stop:6113 length:660 start_codon:yes stop_codon:yes gene_type:complete
MIEFENVSMRYGPGREALVNVSFQINRGELVFLTGHSGAGKSTVLRLILGLETCSGGNLIVRKTRIKDLSRSDLALHRRQIGVVFQDHQLLHDRSVGDNVALPLEIAEFPQREVKRRVRAALDKVGLLHKEKCPPDHLSSGEQQRVGIARAVVSRPHVILADEPTGNLDPELSANIMSVFEQFRSVGVSILIASHDNFLLSQFRHRTLTLDHGRLRSNA